MKLLYIADDFTGASDTLATLARAGLTARLYPRVPEARIAGLDAMGIATGLRGMGREEGCAAATRLAGELAPLAADFVHFKICSTFDSAPDTGNIAAVADILAAARGVQWVAVVGGQPSLRRYCLFGTLFAASGDGTIHRIDRHPVMKAHPVTPMGEADLRRHLAAQGWREMGLVDYRAYAAGAGALADDIARRIAGGESRTLFDVSCEHDLGVIGAALARISRQARILCVGASGVAEALAPRRADLPAPPPIRFNGPVFAIAGSRSPVSARQVMAARQYEKLTLDPADFAGGPPRAAADRAAALLAEGRHVLVSVSDAGHPGLGGRDLAERVAHFAAGIVRRHRPGCFAVAGGDTASAAVEALDLDAIAFVTDLDAGVPLVAAEGGGLDGLPMVLKGGQMGRPGLFDDLAALVRA